MADTRKKVKFKFNLGAGVTIPTNTRFFAKLKDGFNSINDADPTIADRKRINFNGTMQTIGFLPDNYNSFRLVVFCIIDENSIKDEDTVHSNRVRFEFLTADYLGSGTYDNPLGYTSVTITDIIPLSKFRSKAKGFKQSRAVTKNTIIIGAGVPEPPKRIK